MFKALPIEKLDELIQQYQQVKTEYEKKRIVQQIASMRTPLAIEFLINVLNEKDYPLVRRWAAAGLGKLYELGTEAVPHLIETLKTDPDEQVRKWAAVALGNIGDERGIPALIETLLHDPFVEARYRAAAALMKLFAIDAKQALETALFNDPTSEVRGLAANALAFLSTTEDIIDVLLKAFQAGKLTKTMLLDSMSKLRPEIKESMKKRLQEIGTKITD